MNGWGWFRRDREKENDNREAMRLWVLNRWQLLLIEERIAEIEWIIRGLGIDTSGERPLRVDEEGPVENRVLSLFDEKW